MGEVKTFSFSELDKLRQCGFAWALAYVERWNGPVVGQSLSRGTLFHKVLEEHYLNVKAGTVVEQSVQQIAEALAAASPREAQAFEANVELIEWMYGRYQEKWAEADQNMKIISVEQKFEVPLGVGPRSGIEFLFKGKIDLVVEDYNYGGGVWIYDHKTCANLPSKELDLDDQMGLYPWALRELGQEVDGVMYDACRTQRNKGAMTLDQSFARLPIAKTPGELDVIAQECLTEFDIMWAEVLESKARPPRRPNTDTCKWKCAYTEACLMSRRPDVDTVELLVDMGYERYMGRH